MELSFVILALGVFIGNWLIVPLIVKSRTFKDGFWIGLIAMALILILIFVSGCATINQPMTQQEKDVQNMKFLQMESNPHLHYFAPE